MKVVGSCAGGASGQRCAGKTSSWASYAGDRSSSEVEEPVGLTATDPDGPTSLQLQIRDASLAGHPCDKEHRDRRACAAASWTGCANSIKGSKACCTGIAYNSVCAELQATAHAIGQRCWASGTGCDQICSRVISINTCFDPALAIAVLIACGGIREAAA